MNFKRKIFVSLIFISSNITVLAQFNTVTRDTTNYYDLPVGQASMDRERRIIIKENPPTEEVKTDTVKKKKKKMRLPFKIKIEKTKKRQAIKDTVYVIHRDTITNEVKPKSKLNPRDQLLLGLLQERVNVCMPLDFFSMTSRYGYRIDPITSRCTRFHDGIDLRCRYENVYSMLPGVVKKVVHSNTGYGNYVILSHDNIECLYGHLSTIVVVEGEVVRAGDVVAVSGNTGRSTGPHLHIRITRNGQSVDPQPLMQYLDDYISSLQRQLALLDFDDIQQLSLNEENLLFVMERYEVHHEKIVLAQAILETGNFTSRVCREYNNLFGLRHPRTGEYYQFNNWQESVRAYKDYVQYKYKGGDYYRFLDNIGYAEDPAYINKVRAIEQKI